jgi:hypothetical protein
MHFRGFLKDGALETAEIAMDLNRCSILSQVQHTETCTAYSHRAYCHGYVAVFTYPLNGAEKLPGSQLVKKFPAIYVIYWGS